jgi:hypothetical protein
VFRSLAALARSGVSTAHTRCGQPATVLRIAAYPALSVPNRPVASTVSRSSSTSIEQGGPDEIRVRPPN